MWRCKLFLLVASNFFDLRRFYFHVTVFTCIEKIRNVTWVKLLTIEFFHYFWWWWRWELVSVEWLNHERFLVIILARTIATGSQYSETFLQRCSLEKIIWKREHPCQIVISIKLQSNFTEITLWHGWMGDLL